MNIRRSVIEIGAIGAVLSVLTLIPGGSGGAARAEEGTHEDLSPCPGSAPEPTQSAAWSVAFCNRTGHDLVIEFHDNDCPAQDWGRRGDVYQRTLRRGESRTLPLCYASEPVAKRPVPGTPTLRIPGGKGVTTTWNVVGDCGDHSKPLNVDARTFYDRGDYKTGIILLQYPSGASHCSSDGSSVADASSAARSAPLPSGAGAPAVAAAAPAASAAAATSKQSALNGGSTAAASAAQAPTTAAPGATGATVAAVPAAVPSNRGSDPPTFNAVIDPKDIVHHSVQVFAKGGAGYQCNLNLVLTFTDGGSWNDSAKGISIAGNEETPVTTRKYLKSVDKVKMTSSKCTPPT